MAIQVRHQSWQISFVIVVSGLLVTTLLAGSIWWLTGMALASLLVLNAQFLVFPNTADRHLLNRVSLMLVIGLLIIANLKFLVVTSLTL